MPAFQPGFIDVSQILTRRELASVMAYLKTQGLRTDFRVLKHL